MATVVGNYSFEDIYAGLAPAINNGNLGVMCRTVLSLQETYGDCFAFFDASYELSSNNKLKITLKNIRVYQNRWGTKDWILSGSVKANGVTLFNARLTTPSGTSYGSKTMISITDNVYSGEIDYPDGEGELKIKYDFSLYFNTDIDAPAGWKGWTNSSEDTCSITYTYSHDHIYVGVVTPPTCTHRGYTTYTCKFCDKTYISDYTNILGHNWNNGEIETQPTIDEGGQKRYTCLRCGIFYQVPLSKIGALAQLYPTACISRRNEEKKYVPYIYNESDKTWGKYRPYISKDTIFNSYY